jgi:hypothetical protein
LKAFSLDLDFCLETLCGFRGQLRIVTQVTTCYI